MEFKEREFVFKFNVDELNQLYKLLRSQIEGHECAEGNIYNMYNAVKEIVEDEFLFDYKDTYEYKNRVYFKEETADECQNPNVKTCEGCNVRTEYCPSQPVEREIKPNKNNSVIINEDQFEHLLNCMCNQKFLHEQCPRIQNEWQEIIDNAYHEARNLLVNN